MTRWTDNELSIIRARYPSEPTHRIAADMGRTPSQVYQQAHKLGLRKSAEYLASPAAQRVNSTNNRGGATRFKPGHATWNKGKEHRPPGRSAEWQFKPGSTPPNRHPVGHIRMNADGYLDIKTAPGMRKWVALSRWNWRQAHGEYPPKGSTLIFRDGNRLNCAVENLECLTRAELMKRNSVHNLPKELAVICQLRGALNRQINKRAAP
jgi:hypothetical protein